MVHSLVAKHFLVNKNDHKIVNHKDENKMNNHHTNLEWCTPEYNLEYSNARHYKVTDPLGSSYEIFNLSKHCRQHGLHVGAMSEMATKRIRSDNRRPRQHHKGWKCEYVCTFPEQGVNRNNNKEDK